MFDLREILHIDNIHGYSEDDIFNMIYSGGRFMKKRSPSTVKFYDRDDKDNNCFGVKFNIDNNIYLVYTENKNLLLHNEVNIPAQISYYGGGELASIKYVYDGKYHNPYNPAIIDYSTTFTGRKCKIYGRYAYRKQFFIKGSRHNRAGPAYIDYSEEIFEFYSSGRLLNLDTFVKRMVRV